MVLLNQAPVDLAYAVIAQGQLLYNRSVAERVESEAKVLTCTGTIFLMQPEFAGMERRLDELNERLRRLEPLLTKRIDESDHVRGWPRARLEHSDPV